MSHRVPFLISARSTWVSVTCLCALYLACSSQLLCSKWVWDSHEYVACFQLAQGFLHFFTSFLYIFTHFIPSEDLENSNWNRIRFHTGLERSPHICPPSKNHCSMGPISYLRVKEKMSKVDLFREALHTPSSPWLKSPEPLRTLP